MPMIRDSNISYGSSRELYSVHYERRFTTSALSPRGAMILEL